MKSRTVVIAATSGVLALAGAAVAFLWAAQAAVDSAASDSAWSKLGTVVGATLGASITRESRQDSVVETGTLQAAERRPAEFRRDAAVFSTWQSASRIAHSAVTHLADLSHWTSSRALAWIPPIDRNDAWGHAFCVRADGKRAIVASPGPDALADIVCSTIRMNSDDIAGVDSLGFSSARSGAFLVASGERH